jgi:hypothetical protein
MEGSPHNGTEYQAQELGFLAWIIPIRGEVSGALIAAVKGVNRGFFGSSFGGQMLCRELKLD